MRHRHPRRSRLGPPASRSRAVTKSRIEAGQQPAGPRPVRSVRGTPGRARRTPDPTAARRSRRPRRSPTARHHRQTAARRRPHLRAPRGTRAGRRRAPAASAGSASCRTASRARSGAYVSSHARAAATRSSRISRSRPVSGLPFSASIRAPTSTPGIWTSSARWAKAGRNSAGLGRDVGVRVEERVAERRLVARRQLALDLAPRGRRRELVELVEQPRDRVGAVRIELDRLVRTRSQEEEAQLLGRDDLGDRVGRRADALGGRHLLAADVEELVRHVERRLTLEHLAGDRVAPVARATGRRQVLAARARWSRRSSDHWAAHSRFHGSFAVPPNGLIQPDVPQPCAQVTRSARHSKKTFSPSQSVTIVVPTLPQVGQTTPDRVPRLGMLDVGDAAVDLAHEGGPVEGQSG